jgi:predicted short-subunit dehydrogenase-like oxidoreductase (DUF2520 family)
MLKLSLKKLKQRRRCLQATCFGLLLLVVCLHIVLQCILSTVAAAVMYKPQHIIFHTAKAHGASATDLHYAGGEALADGQVMKLLNFQSSATRSTEGPNCSTCDAKREQHC